MNDKPVNRTIATQAGFSLIEVLIAIAIFSVGFMAVGALQTRSLRTVSFSQDKTLAMEALNAQVDVLKRTPLYAEDIWHNDGVGPIFVLSHEFTDQGANPDFSVVNGEYTVSWWIDTPHTIPDRWTGGAPLIISENVTATVVRNGDDPAKDALAQVEFVKFWVTDN